MNMSPTPNLVEQQSPVTEGEHAAIPNERVGSGLEASSRSQAVPSAVPEQGVPTPRTDVDVAGTQSTDPVSVMVPGLGAQSLASLRLSGFSPHTTRFFFMAQRAAERLQ